MSEYCQDYRYKNDNSTENKDLIAVNGIITRFVNICCYNNFVINVLTHSENIYSFLKM